MRNIFLIVSLMNTISKEFQIQQIQMKYSQISDHLNEKTKRIWAATEAKILGYGGIGIVSIATGINFRTIKRGLSDLDNPLSNTTRVRNTGGGRLKITKKQGNLEKDIEALIEPATRGDPESPLRWTSKSTYKLAAALVVQGYSICQRTVCTLLQKMGYSLQANKKTHEGTKDNPDRDAQFLFINEKVKLFHKENNPVISVDTKKKENIGNFKNNGREFHKTGEAPEVNVYDFIDKDLGKVAPYGVYDIQFNTGFVNVGISGDTAEFAVESIKQWWNVVGKDRYQEAKKMYINCDGGGSNGYRVRLWKTELQKLATELDIEIHISHFPPGTSKWNKIEHRMFSFITKNWRGKPLIDYVTVINLIASTTTKKGLTIQARLDENIYEKGIKISDETLAQVHLLKEEFHGEWNYTILPK